MEELKLIITSPEEAQMLQHINWNRQDFEDAIKEVVSGYETAVYTEETLGQAKKDRAELNKIGKAIDERRIQVKKAINKPYEVFEKEVKEVKAELDKTIGFIDNQIKAFEEKAKEDKDFKLQLYFKKAAAGFEDILQYDQVKDSRWLNASYNYTKALADIDSLVEKTRNDIEAIDSLPDEDRPAARNTYYRTRDLSQALADASRIRKIREEQQRAAEEQKNVSHETQIVNNTIDKNVVKGENNTVGSETDNLPPKAEDSLVEAARQHETASSDVAPEETWKDDRIVNAPVIRQASFAIGSYLDQVHRFTQKAQELGITGEVHAEIRISGTEENIYKLKSWMEEDGMRFGRIGQRVQASN